MPHTIPRASGWEIDVARDTICWSARSARLLGCEASARPGLPLPDFYSVVHPPDRARVMRGVTRGIERGRMHIEFRITLPGGRLRRLVANGLVVTDAENTGAVRMVGWFERRSVRRGSGRSMEARDHQMALAASAAGVGFWRVDLVTKTRWLSPFALALFGLGPNDAQTAEMFYEAVHPDDRERVRTLRAALMTTRGPLDDIFRIVQPAKAMRWLHSVAVVVRDDHTGHDHLIGATADVTDRVVAQQTLVEQQHQLAHLARVAAVGELSGAIAHEVSQPITAILNNSRAAERMLERDGRIDRAAFQEILDDIMDASTRAGVVVRRVREFLRNESLASEGIELHGLVIEVVALLRGALLEHRVSVKIEVSTSMPHVRGDRVQLQQVLVNLIMNACDAMAATPPTERLIVITGIARDEGACELIIADRGPGIAAGLEERIFEPFVTSKTNGVGLGLALSRKLVAMHGGRIWAENQFSGAEFHLLLPAGQD